MLGYCFLKSSQNLFNEAYEALSSEERAQIIEEEYDRLTRQQKDMALGNIPLLHEKINKDLQEEKAVLQEQAHEKDCKLNELQKELEKLTVLEKK